VIATLVSFSPGTSLALPLGHPLDRVDRNRVPQAELNASGVDFTAIVALDDCSGSLVRFETSRSDDNALVLTNGHCYEGGFLSPGEVIVEGASQRTFDLLKADGSYLTTLQASAVAYATMTETDVTLYRLDLTYGDIESQYGVQALTISSAHPTAGAPIRVVSGYWKKIYSCSVDGFVYQLREGSWTWDDSIRYSQTGCDVIGGTSGSPILDANSRAIVGINNC
jgi:hypothetical protein